MDQRQHPTAHPPIVSDNAQRGVGLLLHKATIFHIATNRHLCKCIPNTHPNSYTRRRHNPTCTCSQVPERWLSALCGVTVGPEYIHIDSTDVTQPLLRPSVHYPPTRRMLALDASSPDAGIMQGQTSHPRRLVTSTTDALGVPWPSQPLPYRE